MKKILFSVIPFLLIIGCGPSSESLREEWHEYSRSKLEKKMSEIIGENGWYKNTIYDTDEGLQWRYSKGPYIDGGTFLQFLQNGYGRIIIQEVDNFGTIIGRDWASGKWWIQQSPSINGVLADEIVFKAEKASDGLQMDPKNLTDNFAFIDLDEFFAHYDQVPWYNVHLYLEFADDLRFEFMKEKNVIFSKDEGFVKGNINGPITLYWGDEKERVKGEFEDGEKNGHWEWLWYDGFKYVAGKYLKDIKVGEWNWYDPGDKEILMSQNFNNNGELHGNYVTFNKGVKTTDGDYKNGEKNGIWTWRNEAGKTDSSANYVEGNKDGDWFVYNEDGSHIKGVYENNEKSGVWVHYNADGDTMGLWDTNILTQFYGVWRSENTPEPGARELELLTINKYKEMTFGINEFLWQPNFNMNGNETYWKRGWDESSISKHRMIFETKDGEKRIRVTGGEKGHYYVNKKYRHDLHYSDYVGIYKYAGEPKVTYDVQDLLFGKWSDGLDPEVIYEFMSGDDPRAKKYYKYLNSSELNYRYFVMVTFNKNDKKKFNNKMETEIRTLPQHYIDWYNDEYVNEYLEALKKEKNKEAKDIIRGVYGFNDSLVIDTTVYELSLDGSTGYNRKKKKWFDSTFGIDNYNLEIVSISKDKIVTLAEWGGKVNKELADVSDELDDIRDDMNKLCSSSSSDDTKFEKYYDKLEKIYSTSTDGEKTEQFKTIEGETEFVSEWGSGGRNKVMEESKATWKRKHRKKYEKLVSECVSLSKRKNELTDLLQKKITYTLTRIE